MLVDYKQISCELSSTNQNTRLETECLKIVVIGTETNNNKNKQTKSKKKEI